MKTTLTWSEKAYRTHAELLLSLLRGRGERTLKELSSTTGLGESRTSEILRGCERVGVAWRVGRYWRAEARV